MNALSAVVFDLDGTLVDSLDDIASAANHVLARFGLPQRSPNEVAACVGDGARWLMARAARCEPTSVRVDELLKAFLAYYSEHAADRTRPMSGAEDALAALDDRPLALCTNKPRQATDTVLAAMGWEQRFQVVIAGGDLPRRKPDPLPLTYIAQRLAVQAAHLVMVGDGPQDIDCGHAAGCLTVGITGGIGSQPRLLAAKPHLLLESLNELPAALTRFHGAGQ